MIQIILLIAGIYILAKGEVNFSKDRILVKPKSLYVGIALIFNALILGFVSPFVEYGLLIVIMVASYFLSQKGSSGTLLKK
jgi:hypothetical protein